MDRKRFLRPVLVVVVILAVVLTLVIIQPWSVNPQNILAKAYEAVSAVQSYHLIISGSSSSMPDGMTSEHYMEVEFAAPDRYHYLSIDNYNGASEQTHEFIVIGDDLYSHGGNVGGIAITSTLGISAFLDKEVALQYMDMMTDIETMPDDVIGGVNCLHYTGKWDIEKQLAETEKNLRESMSHGPDGDIPEEKIEEMIADMRESLRSMRMDIELWIGKDDYLIRQLMMNQQAPDGPDGIGTSTVIVNIEFTSINEPVIIEPPLDEHGNFLPGWSLVDTHPPAPEPEQQYFGFNMIHTIGSQEGYDDPEHQELEYSITITNKSAETVEIIRLFIINPLLKEYDQSLEVEPEAMGLSLAPGQSHTFHARQSFDASGYTKEEIIEMDEKSVVLVDFKTEDGWQISEMLHTMNAP